MRMLLGLMVLALMGSARADPVVVTAQDVSVKANGGKDYSCFRGHTANQFERDQMEQTLLGIWTPQVIAYMRSVKSCQTQVPSALANLSTILQRLDVVHQYDDVLGPPRRTWQVTVGGRHYQIEGYILEHAQQCSLGSGAAQCGTSPLMTPDLLDLLDLQIVNGKCVKGAQFPAPGPCPAPGAGELIGLVDGRIHFALLSDADAKLLQTAQDAHAGGMCGSPPAGSVQEAQNAFIATATTPAEQHFRTPQPFKGGCDPGWTADECCSWKMLEHREYLAWVDGVKRGDWALARCAGGRHHRMHICANLKDKFTIRMPPCADGVYPDNTPPVTCQAYLARPTP